MEPVGIVSQRLTVLFSWCRSYTLHLGYVNLLARVLTPFSKKWTVYFPAHCALCAIIIEVLIHKSFIVQYNNTLINENNSPEVQYTVVMHISLTRISVHRPISYQSTGLPSSSRHTGDWSETAPRTPIPKQISRRKTNFLARDIEDMKLFSQCQTLMKQKWVTGHKYIRSTLNKCWCWLANGQAAR